MFVMGARNSDNTVVNAGPGGMNKNDTVAVTNYQELIQKNKEKNEIMNKIYEDKLNCNNFKL